MPRPNLFYQQHGKSFNPLLGISAWHEIEAKGKGSVLKLIPANIIKLHEKNREHPPSQSALHYYGFISLLLFCVAHKKSASLIRRWSSGEEKKGVE